MRVFRANLQRLGWIVRVLIAHLLSFQLRALLPRLPWLARRLPPGDLSGPERLSRMLEDLGGTFIKLGQMLALQPDILTLEYCNALFNLMDRVAPFSYEKVAAVVREELGRTPDEIFDAFERRPLATASIGQVHVAYLEGRKLAVKVQRPAVDAEFSGDVRLMAAGIRLIRVLRIRRFYWLLEPLSEFVSWTHEELDYRYEARYLEQLRFNASDNSCERIPAVETAFTTRRLLVAEFLDGVTVLDYLRALDTGDRLLVQRLKSWSFDPGRFARHMIDNFLGDAFRYGIFHADLHPANLMILPDNVVGYIDFGITAVLSRFSRHNLIGLTRAYTRGDLDGMCEAFFRVSAFSAAADPAAFRRGLDELATGWYRQEGKRVRLRKNFTLMMLDMLTLSRHTGILPERDVIKYIRSAIALDGLITRFAPSFDIGLYLSEVCDRQLRQEAQMQMLSLDKLAGWWTASSSLMSDGPLRAAGLMRRLAGGDLPVAAEILPPAGGGGEAPRLKAVWLAVVLFVVSAFVAMEGGDPRLGINLMTAELLLLVATLATLVRTVYRLT